MLIKFFSRSVAVVGNVDAGKSTLLGVLTHGELDNGRGLARQKLFRHKHEIETGRTSSVGNDILGFDSSGNVVNQPEHGSLDWVKICSKATKVVTFIDLAGHEKYLKTTVFGMTGHAPDFSMLMVRLISLTFLFYKITLHSVLSKRAEINVIILCLIFMSRIVGLQIGANAGIVGMTKEHLGLALALNVPVFVVVTKVNMRIDIYILLSLAFTDYLLHINRLICAHQMFYKIRCACF